MEKIYVDSKDVKRTSFFRQFFNDKGSMISTVVVAFVAVIGLVVFGVNQISYAIPDDNANLVSMISNRGEISGGFVDVNGVVNEVLPFSGYYTTGDVPILGIQYDVQYVVNEMYQKNVEIDDPGLVYLVSNLYPNKQLVSTDMVLDNDVQLWLSQSAVWTYLYEIGDAKNTMFTYGDSLRNVNTIYRMTGMNKNVVATLYNDTFYNKFGINNLITEAKKYHSESLINMRISKSSDIISITNDNKYYQTDLISIVSSNNDLIKGFEGYSVDLSKAPSGTILVDEEGNEYTDISKMMPTSKFYVRVPVSKLDGEDKKVELSIIGEFSVTSAYEYSSLNGQSIIMLEDVNKGINKSLEIDFQFIPDVVEASVGNEKTIYFMGIILLLSGLGLIFNTKKNEDK